MPATRPRPSIREHCQLRRSFQQPFDCLQNRGLSPGRPGVVGVASLQYQHDCSKRANLDSSRDALNGTRAEYRLGLPT